MPGGGGGAQSFARHAMDDLKRFLREGENLGRVAIFDGTNTTGKRRRWILKQLEASTSHGTA